ncbi:MAG: GreA/GreB family elongation factor [Alphaproteobacteria bacterium]|nr:GreA/GreB family elongation factor [Alphaproteobacteria bacterium]
MSAEEVSTKPALIAAWRAELEARLAVAARGQSEARAGARVDGDHRPANRGERAAVSAQGYLAQGLQRRIAELSEDLRLLDEVGAEPRAQVVVGALVLLEDEEGEARRLLILPGGDATTLDSALGPVQVLSGQAPLVRALYGLQAGDVGLVRLGGETREVEVVELS